MQSFADEWKGLLHGMSPAQIDRFLADLQPGEAEELVHRWHLWARPSQLPPPGDWRVWLLMAGRGFGKTRAGAEWVRGFAESGAARSIALVGDTEEDVRQVMVDGPSGSNAAIPTDGLSVGSVVLARFTGITNVWYHGGFTFRPARQLNHGPALRYVVLMDDMRPVMGGYIDVGEWRCLNFGMGPFVNRGSWIGLFVRIA